MCRGVPVARYGVPLAVVRSVRVRFRPVARFPAPLMGRGQPAYGSGTLPGLARNSKSQPVSAWVIWSL